MKTNFLDQRKDAIAVHALEVFKRQGYTKTSMKDIMVAAKVSRGGLYGHFSNINDVFILALQIHDHKNENELMEPYSIESVCDWLDSAIDNSLPMTQALSEFMFKHSDNAHPYLEERVSALQLKLASYLKKLNIDSSFEYSVYLITIIDGILINAHHNNQYLETNKKLLKQSLIDIVEKES